MNKAPLVNYTNESERRRSTVSSRLVTAAQYLSDDSIVALLGGDDPERISALLLMASNLGRDQRLMLKESPTYLTPSPIPSELAQEWETFWKIEYGIKFDFSGLIIPAMPVGYKALLLVVPENASQAPEMLFRSDTVAYGGKVWKYTNTSLDEAVPTHKLTGTFGVWVADVQEASDGRVGGINLNSYAVDELGWVTETLPIRQVHGRRYLRTHSKYLDTKVVTLCPCSRAVDGGVPSVGLNSGGHVGVYYWNPFSAAGCVRIRRVVSL